MELPTKECTTYPMLKRFVEQQGVKVIECPQKTTRLYGKAHHTPPVIKIYPLAFKDNVAYQTLLHEYIHIFLGPGFGHHSLFKILLERYGLKPSRFIYRGD